MITSKIHLINSTKTFNFYIPELLGESIITDENKHLFSKKEIKRLRNLNRDFSNENMLYK